MPTFANPLGLLALFGIPALLAIHFLQRKARVLTVSTLFLLDHTRREAAGGRRFERLTASIPMWMQLLAVVLLSWFLAEPRYQKSGSIRRVAVVLDSSASMSVFKDDARKRLAELLPQIQGPAAEMQLTVLESAPNRPRLFAGAPGEALDAAFNDWQPLDGPTDPTQSLRLARSLVSRGGTVLYLTDTPMVRPPFDAQQLAIGDSIENAGFTGVTFATEDGTLVWRALVKNHGTRSVERTWSVHTSAGSTDARPLHLEPGALVTLQSAFPKDVKNVRVVLSPDRFTLDDVMPIIAPSPKPITLFAATPPAFAGLAEKLMGAIEAAEPAKNADSADLTITISTARDSALPAGNAIVFVEEASRAGGWRKGGIITESHPLMDGLNWQSLLARETAELARRPTDSVLLWQDKRPLILLRETKGVRQLLFNFDPNLSNIAQQPAFIVLSHRFAESIRAAKIAPVSANLETGQPIQVTSAASVPLTVSATDVTGKPVSAPGTAMAIHSPGFLTIRQDGNTLLSAAVHFGDPREADFSACASSNPEQGANAAAIERQTRPDPLWRVWLLVLAAALVLSWKFSSRAPLPT